MMEYRVRSRRDEEWVDKYKGSQVTPEMVNILLTSEARVFRPDGKPLCVYLPGAAKDIADLTYPEFTKIRATTDNRGYASGSERVKRNEVDTRTRTVPVMSSIVGAIDRSAAHPACRLTAFNAREVDSWDAMLPMFQRIAHLLETHVPDRYAAQLRAAQATRDDWIIKDTPFTTITVNNTYPTGIHTDKGDLDEGFSTLTTMRRGYYTGGYIGFPQYGVFADMQDGDVLLMDAHDWHGNTPLLCSYCGENLRKPGHRCERMPEAQVTPERISVVSYFRTKMTECGTQAEENERWQEIRQQRNEKALGVDGT